MAIDRDVLVEKGIRALSTGVGVFGSTTVGEFIDNNTDFGAMGVGLGQLGIGYGVAVATDSSFMQDLLRERTGRDSLVADAVEHAGYGVSGAGFAEAADTVQTGQSADQVVRVDARADEQMEEESTGRSRAFSADVG